MLEKRLALLLATIVLLLVLLPACGGGNGDETPTTPGTTATISGTSTATATATATPTASTGPVKIGMVHDWSGPMAISGIYYGDRLIKLVEKQVKDDGGILGGRELKIGKYDGASTVAGIQTAAQKAFYDGMSAIVEGGTSSVQGLVTSEFAEQNHILFCDMVILPYDVSNLKYTLRSGYRLADMTIQADYAIQVLKAKKFALLGRDLEESRHFADLWEDIVDQSGGEVVYKDFLPAGLTDISPYITKVKYKEPDVLLTDLMMDNYATLAAQIGGLGGWGDMKVICNMAAAFQASKSGAQGWVIFARWLPGLDNPGSIRFEADYEAIFNQAPDSAMELMYESIWCAVESIKLAGTDSDRDAIAQAARSGNMGWETPLGYVTWGTDGEPIVKLQLLAEVVNGEMIPVPDW